MLGGWGLGPWGHRCGKRLGCHGAKSMRTGRRARVGDQLGGGCTEAPGGNQDRSSRNSRFSRAIQSCCAVTSVHACVTWACASDRFPHNTTKRFQLQSKRQPKCPQHCTRTVEVYVKGRAEFRSLTFASSISFSCLAILDQCFDAGGGLSSRIVSEGAAFRRQVVTSRRKCRRFTAGQCIASESPYNGLCIDTYISKAFNMGTQPSAIVATPHLPAHPQRKRNPPPEPAHCLVPCKAQLHQCTSQFELVYAPLLYLHRAAGRGFQ